MNDVTTAPVAPALDYNVAVTLPKREGEENALSVSIDASAIPPEARLELLKMAISSIIKNRVNVAEQRANNARKPFVAWAAYEAATAADPLQTAVAKPEGDKPTGDVPPLLDRQAKAMEAVSALLKGEVAAERAKGEGKKRVTVDPLTRTITKVVVDAVFAARKAEGATVPVEGKAPRAYTYPDAVKEVGTDGLAYINAQIDAKVAAGADRAALEKARDARYVTPARILTGLDTPGKKGTELPSLL